MNQKAQTWNMIILIKWIGKSFVSLSGNLASRIIGWMVMGHPHLSYVAIEIGNEAAAALMRSQNTTPTDALRRLFVQSVHVALVH